MYRAFRLLSIFCLLAAASAQTVIVRWDLGTPGGSGAATTQGTGLPFLVALPGVQLHWCNHPANALPCTNYATTYTSISGLTPCATNAQIVLQGSSSCVAAGDNFGDVGVWTAANTVCTVTCYDYTLTYNGQSFGPYVWAPAGGSGGGGGGSGTVVSGTTLCAAYYPLSTASVSANCDLTFPGGGIIHVPSGITGGASPPSLPAGFQGFAFTESATQAVPIAGVQSMRADSVQHTWLANSFNKVVTVTPDFNFSACPAGCTSTISPTTISAGANTITLTPVPVGVNGTDNPHYLKITGTSSPTEFVLITGGTATSGNVAGGTITFTAAFAHASNPPTISSATQGIQEAFWSCTFPGCKVNLMPGAIYEIDAPTFTLGNDSELDGQWATILDASFGSGIVMGGPQTAGWGTDSGTIAAVVHNLDLRPKQINWSVAPSAPASIPGNSPTATLTIGTCPTNAFPDQILWLSGTNAGVPTSFYGYYEPVKVTGGTCTVGAAGTIIIAQATPPGGNNLSTHGSGYTLNGVGGGAYIEDAAGTLGHIHHIRVATGTAGGTKANAFQVDNDQSAQIDNVTVNGIVVTVNSKYQGASVFAPGPFSGSPGNAAIETIGPNNNFQIPGRCVFWFSGNDLTFTGQNTCENYSAGGIVLGTKRGGFGSFTATGDIHFETSGATPWGSILVGNPNFMLVGGINKPLVNYTNNMTTAFSGNLGPYPNFNNQAAQTKSAYYYLVARNNLLNTTLNCTAGGDCYGPPIFIGCAQATDPSATPITVTWYGTGDNGSQPTAYDTLRVMSSSGSCGTGFPQVPTGTGLFGIAINQAPSSICSIDNICTITDNIAPGAESNYTVNSALSFAKRWYPDSFLMPGTVAIAGDGGLIDTTADAAYIGSPACVNGVEFLGGRYIAEFTRHSAGSDSDISKGCPYTVAPVAFKGPMTYCLNSASPAVCGFSSAGSVAMAASATTITVNTTAVTPWSTFTPPSEDTTKGAVLGVTCNTTTGRTYSVTAVVPGVSFTITASAAPTTNPACLDFRVVNGS